VKIIAVTVVHGRHDHLQRQRVMLDRSDRRVDHHVVVAMDDPQISGLLTGSGQTSTITIPAEDLGLPLAAARNAGARIASSLGAELLIFLDVDCLPAAGMVAAYADAASDPSSRRTLLCGPVAYLPPPAAGGYDLARLAAHEPHPARPAPRLGQRLAGNDPRLFWSLSFAVTMATWAEVGGFCEQYVGYGGEDTDFGFAARAAGVRLTWVGGADAYHQWHPTQSPPIAHLDDILRNGAVFARRWGRWPMEGWIDAFRDRGLVRWDEPTKRYVRTEPVPTGLVQEGRAR
jgi:GT2 family glycosyltransferase